MLCHHKSFDVVGRGFANSKSQDLLMGNLSMSTTLSTGKADTKPSISVSRQSMPFSVHSVSTKTVGLELSALLQRLLGVFALSSFRRMRATVGNNYVLEVGDPWFRMQSSRDMFRAQHPW
jgi:hypothetical protein